MTDFIHPQLDLSSLKHDDGVVRGVAEKDDVKII